jgi:hypothetical protein
MTVLAILLKIYSNNLHVFITSFLFPSSMAASCLSIWLMFKNLTLLRKFYQRCVETIAACQEKYPPEDLQSTKKEIAYDKKRVHISEAIAKYCLLYNFLIFIVIVTYGNEIFECAVN